MNNTGEDPQQGSSKGRGGVGGGASRKRPHNAVNSVVVDDNDFDQKVTPQLVKYFEDFRFPHIRDISSYEKVMKIGQDRYYAEYTLFVSEPQRESRFSAEM